MWHRLRAWLNAAQLTDSLERQQAPMLQLFLLGVLGAVVLGLPFSMITNPSSSSRLISALSYGLVLAVLGGALALLRHGRFKAAVLVTSLGIVTILSGTFAAVGILSNTASVMLLAIPIVLAGLLLDRRSFFVVIGVSSVLVGIVVALDYNGSALVNEAPSRATTVGSLVLALALNFALLTLFLDRFGGALRRALHETQEREHALQELQISLETTVAERTADLAAALQAGEQREATLAATLNTLQARDAALREMSAPVLPVMPGILVAPLIGAIDVERAQHFTANVLQSIERGDVRRLIMDVTGVPEIDTSVAQTLLNTAAAVRMLGAQVVLVGVRPEVAQTLVTLGIDLHSLAPYLDLQEAVLALLNRDRSPRQRSIKA